MPQSKRITSPPVLIRSRSEQMTLPASLPPLGALRGETDLDSHHRGHRTERTPSFVISYAPTTFVTVGLGTASPPAFAATT